jgi:hypothetical protein
MKTEYWDLDMYYFAKDRETKKGIKRMKEKDEDCFKNHWALAFQMGNDVLHVWVCLISLDDEKRVKCFIFDWLIVRRILE